MSEIYFTYLITLLTLFRSHWCSKLILHYIQCLGLTVIPFAVLTLVTEKERFNVGLTQLGK